MRRTRAIPWPKGCTLSPRDTASKTPPAYTRSREPYERETPRVYNARIGGGGDGERLSFLARGGSSGSLCIIMPSRERERDALLSKPRGNKWVIDVLSGGSGAYMSIVFRWLIDSDFLPCARLITLAAFCKWYYIWIDRTLCAFKLVRFMRAQTQLRCVICVTNCDRLSTWRFHAYSYTCLITYKCCIISGDYFSLTIIDYVSLDCFKSSMKV